MGTENYTVYVHKNKENGKIYIGITSQETKRRWKNGNGYSKKSHFGRAIKKYGWDGFEHIIIVNDISSDKAKEIEKALIALFDSTNPNNGYNEALGGEGGGMYGKHQSDKTKIKISEARKRSGFTEEHKKHISESKTGTKHHLAKPVYQYTKDGEFLSEWPYMGMAAKALNINKSSISGCCLGRRTSAGGFVWSYDKKE